jgi:capsule polysaccharide export protein KpsE/RkpR
MGDGMITERSVNRMKEDDVSLFAIGNTVLRHRWRIARWALVGGVLAVLPVLFAKPEYTANASFMPQTAQDPARAGLANLAGQFGLQLGGGTQQGQTPEFYVSLLESRVILAPILDDTFVVSEQPARRGTLLDLLEIEGPQSPQRIERGVEALKGRIGTRIATKTGVVMVSVHMPWASLSRDVTDSLLAGVNAFNLRTRQSQASEERRFTEGRLAAARSDLRDAEDRLQGFLQRNRRIEHSPQLIFERERLQREVTLQQQIVTSLAQAHEEVRIREVRDTPLITVIERPTIPTHADPSGRFKRGIAGLMAGAFLGMFFAFTRDVFRRRHASHDPDAEEFRRSLTEVKAEVARLLPGRRGGAEVP